MSVKLPVEFSCQGFTDFGSDVLWKPVCNQFMGYKPHYHIYFIPHICVCRRFCGGEEAITRGRKRSQLAAAIEAGMRGEEGEGREGENGGPLKVSRHGQSSGERRRKDLFVKGLHPQRSSDLDKKMHITVLIGRVCWCMSTLVEHQAEYANLSNTIHCFVFFSFFCVAALVQHSSARAVRPKSGEWASLC